MKQRLLRLFAARNRLIAAPADVDAYSDLIQALGIEEKAPVSVAMARRLVLVDPLNIAARELLLVLDRMDPTQAVRQLRRCLVVDPTSYTALLHGGKQFRDRDELAQAEALFLRALVLHPRETLPREQLWKVREGWGWGGRGLVGAFQLSKKFEETPRFFRTAQARFFPRSMVEFDDLDTILRRDIFHGYLPERPLIAADRPVVAMGSCFAQHIRQFLLRHGRLSEHVPMPEGLNNTFAIRQFVDWVEGRDDLVYSYEKSADGTMQRWDIDKDRKPFRDAVAKAGGFIITVGVAEVWRDRATRQVYWRGVPADHYDPEKHEHARSTVEENADNLRAIADGLRRVAGPTPIVFTLSPVPLMATMRENTSIFAADTVSKSTLRLAIESVMSDGRETVRYWPSFEAFRWLGAHLDRSLYNGEQNPRHPSPDMIGRIIELFVDSYFEPALPAATAVGSAAS